jgi:ubiquinone/menaquinone biosynthesis C-methylase UbiE
LSGRVCPWWLGYLLASPIRRLLSDPKALLTPYVRNGMIVLEVGSGMGFFTLPLAEMVGSTGKVIGIDLQEKMLRGLRKRAAKAGLDNRIEARVCAPNALNINDLAGKADFAFVFAVMHEVPDKERMLSEIASATKQGGKLLVADPTGHETAKNFNETITLAQAAGFLALDRPIIRRNYAVLLQKSAGK